MTKIKKVNEMSDKKITKDDLLDWMSDNGEDVIIDGPFDFTNEQIELFLSKINSNKKLLKRLVKDGVIYDDEKIDDIGLCSVGNDDKSCDMILDVFVDFLAEVGWQKIPN